MIAFFWVAVKARAALISERASFLRSVAIEEIAGNFN
jgi:hypothetical protein